MSILSSGFLQQLLSNRGISGSLPQSSEQPQNDFGGGLAMEPPRSDDGSGGTIEEISTPTPSQRLDPSTYTTTVPFRRPSGIGFGGFPQQPRRGFGGYGGMGMNPMMGMGLGGMFGGGMGQMGGFYGGGFGGGFMPRNNPYSFGGLGGFGGFGGGYSPMYGGMGGFGMSPYQNQFQNQGMMNQGLGAYNRGMMENQRMVGTLQPQQQQQAMPQQQAQPQTLNNQYQRAFY